MNELAPIIESLPSLVSRAASALANATTAAEVLEARDTATGVYDAAKRGARLAKAKGAHDEVIAAVYRAQADALLIESRAKTRLADEYDAAQDRGDVAKLGTNQHVEGVPDGNTLPTAEDIGLTRKQVHEARQIRDAEKAQPGVVAQILEQRLANGQEPTRTALREAVVEAATAGLKAGPRSVSRRNPDYQPDPQWDAMLAVSAGCRDMMEKVRHLDAAYILGGFVDVQQRERNLSSIREARNFLTSLLEYADAQ